MEKLVIMLSTYNGEKFLDKQLESIWKQETDSEIVLFVRDDGSSDKTVEILKAWEKKINIIWEETHDNLKPAQSFWRLLETAPQADYYAFCDQDDYWYSCKLQMATDKIKSLREKNILYCGNSRLVDENGKELILNKDNNKYCPAFDITSQLVCGEGQGCTMVMDSAMRKLLIDLKIKNIPSHDWICMIYALALGKVIFDSRYCMDYRQHSANVVSKVNKSIYRKLKQKYMLWYISSKKYSSADVAAELLQKCRPVLDKETQKFLQYLSEYRVSLYAKKWLFLRKYQCKDSRAIISFKIRLILNML